jgi:hypothetical protein
MKISLIIFFLVFWTQSSQAELVIKEDALTEEGEEVVIDLSYLAGLTFEDPHFSEPKEVRDIAEASDQGRKMFFWNTGSSSPREWRGGELQVLKDIPFSYPSRSRMAIEAEVLEELKKQSKSVSE